MSKQNKLQDKSLHTKERGITKSYSKASWWWLCRYVGDLQYIDESDFVLDMGCGCGVGTSILAEKSKKVIGIDDSIEAIEFAKTYWQRDNIEYFCKDAFEENRVFDVVVAHELIEHIKDATALFVKFSKIVKKYLIFTIPLDTDTIKSKYHWKHYSLEEIKSLLYNNGFELIKIKFMGLPYYVAKKGGKDE